MDQELFERVVKRCVGHEDDPVALTKGEVRQLVDWFNKDRDGLAAKLMDSEQAYQGCSINDEKHLKEAAEVIRDLESKLNDKNFDIMGYRERIRVLEEANELLRHNRDRANSEIVRLTRDASMSSQAICSLRAQLAKANEKADYLQKCGENCERLTKENHALREQAQMWKEFHDQNISMQHAFDEARKRMRS